MKKQIIRWKIQEYLQMMYYLILQVHLLDRSAVYRGKDKANVNQHVCIIRPTKDFDSDFIQLNLASNFWTKTNRC